MGSADMRIGTMDVAEYGIWRYEKRDHGRRRIIMGSANMRTETMAAGESP